MSLPFLPLKPAGAPVGTAMDDALGQPDMAIIRNILANIHAGDEEGAQEEACRAVDSWLATAKVHSQNLKGWVVPDEELWAKLVDNVFRNAPHPPTTLDPPVTNREWFYDMCQRYKDLREFRERPDVQQLLAFKAAQEASWDQFRRLRAIAGTNPVRERRRGVWKRAKLRAYRLWKALPHTDLNDLYNQFLNATQPITPQDNVKDLYNRLMFLERRITEWDPPLLNEEADNGEYPGHAGVDPEYDKPEDDRLFYYEYDREGFNPPWLPQSP
jgi:hypothetical protein